MPVGERVGVVEQVGDVLPRSRLPKRAVSGCAPALEACMEAEAVARRRAGGGG